MIFLAVVPVCFRGAVTSPLRVMALGASSQNVVERTPPCPDG